MWESLSNWVLVVCKLISSVQLSWGWCGGGPVCSYYLFKHWSHAELHFPDKCVNCGRRANPSMRELRALARNSLYGTWTGIMCWEFRTYLCTLRMLDYKPIVASWITWFILLHTNYIGKQLSADIMWFHHFSCCINSNNMTISIEDITLVTFNLKLVQLNVKQILWAIGMEIIQELLLARIGMTYSNAPKMYEIILAFGVKKTVSASDDPLDWGNLTA